MELSMRRFTCLVAVVSLCACASRAKRSVTLYDAGDYAGAARAADEGLAQHPNDDALWAMRIRAALALGDSDGVAKAYDAYVGQRGDDDKELLRDLATATLGQALASPSAHLKIAAIAAVEELELHALTDEVFAKLADEDDRVAASAAVAVLNGHPEAPQIADEMLKSENAEARRIAVDGIGKKVGKLAVADLEKAADDHDARVRRAAIHWLGMIKDTDAVEVLTRRMHDPDDAVRAGAATALAQIAIGNLEAFGKQALNDHALAVRLAGIELLVAAHRDDELVALTDDPDPIVGIQAAIVVKKTHPALALKAVERAITAESWTTRAGAANLLVQAIGKEAALPIARKLAADPELGVRLAAARVLAHDGDLQTASRVFAAALGAPDQGVQAAADLAALGDPAGARALSSFLRDLKRTPEQRSTAAAAHRTAHRVTPGLVAALADPNGLVRVEAAAAIGSLAK
jgi:HEAT repeat protein